MRILIHGLNFAPELTGIGKYTGELAAFLAEKGHSVRVITAPPYYPQWQIETGYSGRRYKRENLRGVEVLRCPLWVPKNPSGMKRIVHLLSFAVFSLPAMLLQLQWRPEIVFTIVPTMFSAPLCVLVARAVGGVSWMHVQDFELEAAFRLNLVKGGMKLQPIVEKIEHKILHAFDRLSTISESMAERLIEKDIPSDHVSLIPNWVDTELIYPLQGENPIRKELGIPAEKIVVLYSGNMGRKQGLEILIESAGELKNDEYILFVLCGDGAVRFDLEAQAREMPNVVFLPLQPVERLNLLLNIADIHVLPQRSDAADLVMPSKLSGMLSSARPVIACANPDTELYRVVSSVGKVVPPENAQTLAEAIRLLAQEEGQRAYYGELGRAFAKEHWDRNVIFNRLEDELLGILVSDDMIIR